MSSIFPIFQRPDIAHKMRRASTVYGKHNFLFAEAAKSICERLRDITRVFENILILSPRESDFLRQNFPDATIMVLPIHEPVCDPENIPTDKTYDLIISLWDLHRANDLPGVLVCLRRLLNPDGVFLAAFPGGETLHELRDSLMQAEIVTMGGASPRVFPFVDKQQVGALLQRAGFQLPVVDSDLIQVAYRDIFHLMGDLRGMGESNSLAGRYKYFTPSRLFFEAGQYYASHYAGDDGRINASFEIIYIIGWAPHESQQQPARRGSGQVSLKDVL